MAVSNEYLELLNQLSPRDENRANGNLLTWWKEFRNSYSYSDNTFTLYALTAIAEIALTIVAKHKAQEDIIFKRSFEWHFGALIGEMHQLHRNKNAGYSGHNDDPWHNFRICNTFGVSTEHGIIARMCDKYARYTNIISDPSLEMVGEQWYDTLMDLAAYSLILSLLIGEQS